MNILVVEDQPVVRELLNAIASSAFAGSRVQVAANLEAALDVARATPMDVVLLDLGLPGCQGVDSVKRFKAAFPGLVIVVVSSNEDSQVIADALEAGASGYLPKGLTPGGLTRALGGVQVGARP